VNMVLIRDTALRSSRLSRAERSALPHRGDVGFDRLPIAPVLGEPRE
jgi:hypothetical protein